MAFVEVLITITVVLLVFILWKLYQSKEDGKTDTTAFGTVMKLLGNLEATIKEKEKAEEARIKEDRERQQKSEKNIEDFIRTISGTKKRGVVGESLLKETLSVAIKAGLIKLGLKVDGKEVEFAWDVGNGKYLPIDSKLPDVTELFEKFNNTEDVGEQKKIKKEIMNKVEKHKQEILKYKNKSNTIDKCIVAVSDGIIDMIPEINSDYAETGVIVSGYNTIFFYGTLIAELYRRSSEKGDIGDYQQAINDLKSIVSAIKGSTESIDRGIVIVSNANQAIKEQTIQSERFNISNKIKEK